MNITITNRKDFLRVLNQCSKVIASKNYTPILDYFKIEIENSYMKITAKNAENTLIKNIMVQSMDGGSFCISAKDFKEAINLLTVDSFDIIVDIANKTCVIKYGKGKMKLPIESAYEYPTLENVEYTSHFELDPHILFDAIEQGKSFCGHDELRPIMNSLYMYIKDKKMGFVSTDGHRLYWKEVDTDKDVEVGVINNVASLPIIQDLVNGLFSCEVYVCDRYVKYDTNNGTFVCRLIDGRFPGFRSVVDRNQPIVCKVSKIELIEAVRRCSFGASNASKLIAVDIKSNELKVTGEDIDFAKNVSESVQCECDSDLRIGLKSEYLLSILSNINTEKVEMRMTDASKAVVFFNDGEESLTMLLMPMMLLN